MLGIILYRVYNIGYYLGGSKGSIVEAVNPPVAENEGGVIRGSLGKARRSSLSMTLEYQLALVDSSTLMPVPCRLSPALLVAPSPMTSFEIEGVRLQQAYSMKF